MEEEQEQDMEVTLEPLKDSPNQFSSENLRYVNLTNDPTFAHRFSYMMSRGVGFSKLLDMGALRALGLENEVKQLFANIGCVKFLKIQPVVYPEIACEFMDQEVHLEWLC